MIHKSADAATKARIEADLEKRSAATAAKMKAEDIPVRSRAGGGSIMSGRNREVARARYVWGLQQSRSRLFELQKEEPFFSALARAVETSKTGKASGEQWLATLATRRA